MVRTSVHGLGRQTSLLTFEDEGQPKGLIFVTKSRRFLSEPSPTELKRLYREKLAVEPFVRTNTLVSLAATSSIHAICLQRKARVIAGLGIKPVTRAPERKYRSLVERYESKDSTEISDAEYRKAQRELTKIETERERLQRWLDTAGGSVPLREVLERFVYDRQNVGWGAVEVLRNGKGEPIEIRHLPAHLVRRMRDGERFVYMKRPTEFVYYKTYGEQRHLHAQRGEWSNRPLPDEDEANELLFWAQYHPADLFYGLPQWYAALSELLGSVEARDFMLYFFTRKATPTYAVLLEGGAWNQSTIEAVRHFFRRDLLSDYHATLALEVPPGGKITFERVTEEARGLALVQRYLDTLRDAIISAHGLFPAIVGVIETAHLGAGTGDTQMSLFKSVVIRPEQEALENLLNVCFVWSPREGRLGGLGCDTQILKLDEIDLWDEAVEAQIISNLYCNAQRPVLTANEARRRLRLEPIEDERNADTLLFTGQVWKRLVDVTEAPEGVAPGSLPFENAGGVTWD